MSEISEKKIVNSFSWQLIQNVLIQVASFAIQILLARLLFPDDYGILSIVLVFINLANVFTTSGYGQALIQKKNSTVEDFSTVFFFVLFLSFFLSLIIFLFANLIANYYEKEVLRPLLKVSIILLPLSSVISIQEAKLKIDLNFKLIFNINIIALVISWGVGVYCAYSGLGVWSLLIHQILYKLIIAFLYFFFSKLKLRFYFSFEKLRVLISFGSKLLLASLIVNIYEEVRGLVIAKRYSSEDLGFFNRGKQFPMTIVNSINSTIQNVMYTVNAKNQDDLTEIKRMHKTVIECTSFIVFPICVGLAVVSRPLIIVLLTEKWLPAVPFLIIFCVYYLMWPLRETCQQVMSSIGRSDLFLKVEIIQKIIGIIVLLSTMFINVYAIGIGMIVDGIISTLINMHTVGRLIDYPVKGQILSVSKNFMCSNIMGVIVYFLSYINLPSLYTLVLQVLSGIIIYVLIAFISKNNAIEYMKNVIKKMRESKNVN